MKPIDPSQYDRQLEAKLNRFIEQFSEFAMPEIDVFASQPLNFRMRAEFRIWHENGQASYAMNHPGEKRSYIIKDFPIGSTLINQLMPQLLEIINRNNHLSHRLFSMEFLTTLSGEVLVTLIYHRPLDNAWETAAREIQKTLKISIIGRSRKQKMVLERDYVTEQLTVDGKSYRYQQIENGFTQPNARVNEKMLAWAKECTKTSDGDLLELYCGNGNFTVVLAENFRQVLATEISNISVKSANLNFKANHIDNVTVVRMSSEEFTQALNKERPFRRLKDIDLDSYRFSTVFVDPPRSGLDSETEKLVSNFDHILYISCNPDTLKNNLYKITKTHHIRKAAIFDQFPWTDHLESGVFLSKKS